MLNRINTAVDLLTVGNYRGRIRGVQGNARRLRHNVHDPACGISPDSIVDAEATKLCLRNHRHVHEREGEVHKIVDVEDVACNDLYPNDDLNKLNVVQ